MNVYLDITLLPGADISNYFLWEKVYQQIHLGLVENQASNGANIGLAFPEYSRECCQLGSKLRLFALNQNILEQFNAKKWLNRLTDYTHITSSRNVPKNIKSYSRFKRKQSKSSIERLARRKANYELTSFEQALQSLKNKKEVMLNAPFVRVTSRTSGKSFRLFIEKENVAEQINNGFSCYGLSAESSLPDF